MIEKNSVENVHAKQIFCVENSFSGIAENLLIESSVKFKPIGSTAINTKHQ